jgi:hypothetical protein
MMQWNMIDSRTYGCIEFVNHLIDELGGSEYVGSAIQVKCALVKRTADHGSVVAVAEILVKVRFNIERQVPNGPVCKRKVGTSRM